VRRITSAQEFKASLSNVSETLSERKEKGRMREKSL
jgi:hypothetical protein